MPVHRVQKVLRVPLVHPGLLPQCLVQKVRRVLRVLRVPKVPLVQPSTFSLPTRWGLSIFQS